MPVQVLMATVAAVAIIPLLLLFWVGWRLRDREVSAARQQIAQRVETAADIVTAALGRAVAASRQRMEAGATAWPPGVVSIVMRAGRITAEPRGRLAWTPDATALPQADSLLFAEGEALEFQVRDAAGAERVYRQMFGSADMAVRAGAGIRLARVLRMQGREQDALRTLREMGNWDGVAIDGTPAALVAMDALGDSGRVRSEIRRGRWLLARPVYALYAGEADGEAEQLSRAASALVARWRRRDPDATGASVVEGVAVLHRSRADETRALLAGPEFVEAQWLKPAREAAAVQRVRLTLATDGTGALRRAAETGLPWDVWVESVSPGAEMAELTGRQRLMESGFALLAVLTLTAAVFAIRAVRREWEVSRLQSEFVSAVSHEFRTPLTSLRQFTEMLRDGREISETRRQLCYDAQARAADRLTRLVESLLDFSRMESGGRPYRLEMREAGLLVRGVVNAFNAEIQPSGRAVLLDSSAVGMVEADEEAFGVALWNLLDNGFKYSPGEKTVHVSAERRGDCVAIRVCDRGIGIPRQERAHIFGRFRRGEQAGRLGIKGTGIGLSMAKHIVQAHGGKIELESEPGNGSCFTIVLPLKEAKCHEF
jgi:signal transduction histidine kinase